jgi:hypothetical protein
MEDQTNQSEQSEVKKKSIFSYNLKEDWVESLLIIALILVACHDYLSNQAYRDFMNNQVGYCTNLLNNIEMYTEGKGELDGELGGLNNSLMNELNGLDDGLNNSLSS